MSTDFAAAPTDFDRPGKEGPTVCLLGGAVSTGNLGVSTLGVSTVKGILQGLPGARIVLQNWNNTDMVEIHVGERRLVLPSTRLHEGSTLRARSGTRHLGLLAALHEWLPWPLKHIIYASNHTFGRLISVDVFLDVCGGDSFTDIYGLRGLKYQSDVKHLIMRMGKPLILMPQTYGPFTTPESRQLVRRIMDYCALVATRETGGIEELGAIFGGWLPKHMVACPDTAFILDPVRVDADREPFVFGEGRDHPLVGLNVSGLLYLSERRFGLRQPYAHLISAIANWVLSDPDRRLLLIPHVISTRPPDQDSTVLNRTEDVTDTAACSVVAQELTRRFGSRIGCLGWPYTESETKYLIGQCDFMIGARMHACIAAISQNVPTVTLAYSKKAKGVMGHLGRWAPVLDLRQLSIDECIDLTGRWYERRDEVHTELVPVTARIRAEVEHFFTECLPSAILDSVGSRRSPAS